MNIADDLARAFNDGYEKGFAAGEAYLLHCGDTDEPQTNADRIRSMSDEELAKKMSGLESFALTCEGGWPPEKWLEWLRKEVNDGCTD